MRYLTFALAKGRLAKKTLTYLEKIGIEMEEMKDPDTRKLIFVNEDLKIKMFYPRLRTCRLMWSMVRRISGLSARIRFWRREESSTRLWIWASANAACVSADRKAPGTSKTPAAYPCGVEISEYCQRLF